MLYPFGTLILNSVTPKILIVTVCKWNHLVVHSNNKFKHADGVENNVGHDQTSSYGAV